MLSTGILSRIKNNYTAKDQQTNKEPANGVSFEAVMPLVGFLATGIFLSTAALFIELGVHRLLKRQPTLISLSISKLGGVRVH
jgi:hypothetical protein